MYSYELIFVLDFELSADGLKINLQLATDKEDRAKTIS